MARSIVCKWTHIYMQKRNIFFFFLFKQRFYAFILLSTLRKKRGNNKFKLLFLKKTITQNIKLHFHLFIVVGYFCWYVYVKWEKRKKTYVYRFKRWRRFVCTCWILLHINRHQTSNRPTFQRSSLWGFFSCSFGNKSLRLTKHQKK